jgi:hypothetical protein
VNSDTQAMSQPRTSTPTAREDFSDYVAHLHIHMGLQSRKLTRPMVYGGDSCDRLLQQSQASVETQASRNS